MQNITRIMAVVAVVLAYVSAAQAVNMETVSVGNPGNTGELSGEGAGGYGPDVIVGAVSYRYNIGKYEVTAGQYTEFLNQVAGVDTYGLYNTKMWSDFKGCKIERYAGSGTTANPYQYQVATDYLNRPVNYVSWGDAARFANWLHNDQPTGAQDLTTTEDGAYFLNGTTTNQGLIAVSREADWKWAIASEDEWYKAAYHKNDGVTGNYFDYPTGTYTRPGRDITEATNPGNNANYYETSVPIDPPYYITIVGEFELSDSPYSTFDQGGNMLEWNETAVETIHGPCRGLRGGTFGYDYKDDLHAAARDYWFPSYEMDGFIGFRVVEVPTAPADFNADHCVDVDDFVVFESCVSGPAIPHDGTETCQQADFDDDNDVDQTDFGIFQRCYSGEGNPADPNCAY